MSSILSPRRALEVTGLRRNTGWDTTLYQPCRSYPSFAPCAWRFHGTQQSLLQQTRQSCRWKMNSAPPLARYSKPRGGRISERWALSCRIRRPGFPIWPGCSIHGMLPSPSPPERRLRRFAHSLWRLVASVRENLRPWQLPSHMSESVQQSCSALRSNRSNRRSPSPLWIAVSCWKRKI